MTKKQNDSKNKIIRVKYIGENDPLELLSGKVYDVIEVDETSGWYRIVDETREDYLFDPEAFEIVEESQRKMLMSDSLKDLSKKQISFICSECRLTKEELFALNEDDLYDKVYDVMCDIEIAEIPLDDTPETEHCKMASDLVTILGNTIEVEEDYSDDEEEKTDTSKVDLMEESRGQDVKITLSDGSVVEGNVKVFETAYDNEDDDGGKAEASICLVTKDGDGVGFYESDIQSIEIL